MSRTLLRTWFDSLRSRCRPASSAGKQPHRSLRPSLEWLEDRVTPANIQLTNALLVSGQNAPISAPSDGETVVVRAEWRTTDLTPSDSYVVRYWFDGVPVDSGVITGQAGTNLSYSWYRGIGYASPGSHTINVTVDGGNAVAESNENDNSATFNVNTVAPTTLPQKLSVFPIGGRPFADWSIVNYVDVDVRGGQTKDWLGGPFQYDGHDAFDIGLPNFTRMDAGIPVFAAADGTVSQVQDGNFDRETAANANPANFVVIDHGNGWSTVYFHFAVNTIAVQVGEAVKAGQVIGLVGSSGPSTDAHLHFGVFHNGANVETNYNLPAYWEPLTAPAYQGSLPTTITDAGVTNYVLWNDFKERPSGVTVFPTSTSWDVWFWSRLSHLNIGDTVNVRWYRPSGTQQTFYTYNAMDVVRYGSFAWTLPRSSWSQFTGTWQVVMEVNGVEKVRRSFDVTSGAGLPEIRLTQSSTYVLDERTTPIDFGTVNLGSSAPQRTLTIENHGAATLNVSGLVLPPGFSLVGSLPAAVSAGSNANFTLQMDTVVAGKQFGQVRFTTNDADEGEFRFNVAGTVQGAAVAGAPVITLSRRARPYQLGESPRPLDAGATLSDSDSTTFQSLTVELASGAAPMDQLRILNQGSGPGQVGVSGNTISFSGTVIGTFSGGTGYTPLVVTWNGSATLAAVQEVMRNISFSAVPDGNTAPRYVRFRVVDNTSKTSNLAIETADVYQGRNLSLPATLDQTLNLRFFSSYFQNYGGQNERWLFGDGTSYFIKPNGQFFRWDGTPNAATGTLLATLEPLYWERPQLLYDAQSLSLPATLDLALNLYFFSSYFQNYGGQNERWLFGDGVSYFIKPSGQFFRWDGSPNAATGTLLATLEPLYWEQPQLLYDAQNLSLPATLDQTLNLRFFSSYFQNYGGQNERWLFGDGASYFIKPNGQFFRWDGTPNAATGTLLATLAPVYWEQPQLLYDAQNLSMAATLDLALNLRFFSSYYQNYGGQNEKWLFGDGASYFIKPNGQFFRWDGTPNAATGTLLATLDAYFWQQPEEVFNPRLG